MGYTVRSDDGFRFTNYVKYNEGVHRGEWLQGTDDAELYDYNIDPWETVNRASDPAYAAVVKRLSAVLREKYTKS